MAGDLVVGIGTDDSGVDAAMHAARLARKAGVSLVLVFGYEASSLGPRGGPLEDQIEVIADEITAGVKAKLAASFPDVAVAVELVRDRPVDSLIRVAEDRGAEVIVVGHGGSGPLRAALLGSITYELVHRSPIPVLIVPDKELA